MWSRKSWWPAGRGVHLQPASLLGLFGRGRGAHLQLAGLLRVCLGRYGGQLCLLSLLLHGRPELKAAVEEKPEVEAGRTELGAAELRPVNYGRREEQSWPGRGGQRQRSSSASPPRSSV